MEAEKRIFHSDITNKSSCVCAAASIFKTQQNIIESYRLQFKDFMDFIEGLNYQNLATIELSVITKVSKSSKPRVNENY